MSIPTSFDPHGTLEASHEPPLPQGYTRLKCLVGKNKPNRTWIDTGFDAAGNVRWVLDMQFNGINQFIGAFPQFGGRFEVDIADNLSSYVVRIADSDYYYSKASGAVRRSVDIDLPNRRVAWSDAGPQEITTVPTWRGTGLDILLFARAQYDGDVPIQTYDYKIYRSTIYIGGELVQDLVPALDPNGIPCFFDHVTGEPFYNVGTAAFNYETL